MREKHLIRLFGIYILSAIFLLLSHSLAMAFEKEIKNLSSVMAEKITTAGKKTIAVVDFTDLQGNVTELGRFIAEELSLALLNEEKGFQVVDRTHLKRLISEHKLSSKGIMDPKTVGKLGQIAGVQALITGTITPFGDSIRLSVKALDTETAKMISGTSGNIAKTKAIEELLARGISTGFTSDPILPPPTLVGKPVEAEGFIFRPVQCKRNGNKIICTITFFNSEKDETKSYVYGSRAGTYMYDNLGNKYDVDVQIGKEKDNHRVAQNFVPQLPINVAFIAKEVSEQARYVTVAIRIEYFNKTVVVRNIPITK